MVQPIVTSGEESPIQSDHSHDQTEEESDEDGDCVNSENPRRRQSSRTFDMEDDDGENNFFANLEKDHLYDENADKEDEAFVQQHLRQGVTPSLHDQSTARSPDQSGTSNTERQNITKSKTDTVLSCPCCFLTVCMDCQQHERYPNQYRAMFVMNIIVRWDLVLAYDRRQKLLVPYQQPTTAASSSNQETSNVSIIPQRDRDLNPMQSNDTITTEDEIYYTVCCANCNTQVASLDMRDEVYHFSGCLVSA